LANETKQLDPEAQLIVDLVKYVTATEGQLVPPEAGAKPGTMGCKMKRVEDAFCAVLTALERNQ
jgi:hypothetical protein